MHAALEKDPPPDPASLQPPTGIAHVAAQRGLTVLLSDTSATAIERGLSGLQKSLERLVRKGSVTPDDAAATLGRIHTSHGSLEVAAFKDAFWSSRTTPPVSSYAAFAILYYFLTFLPFSYSFFRFSHSSFPGESNKVVRASLVFRVGVGLDTCLNIMRTLHSQFGDSKYRPCPLLVQYVDGGLLGVKNGRGVFQYDPLIHDIIHAQQPHVNLTHNIGHSATSSYSV
ncbi:hypothetical protein VOLCADRAFT_120914 [Volvox carteri f. nagariensis]|uniref:Uncharacterized protein n=1 Tax=Volvox carteri f. nagariensis TaxID=3068 RepID=D8TWL5_VOLCA|nr:uncharacterized protein VOLCADRAFT_120914 [Volvox carteri f. nagariensis]EFJ48172.1 hypothetical protein VOLCADRAFT_120914 [Volvox carteri f. nagariensis]|eukprot:XP_002950857.1 hypothetical protein VOLCADRAFT_120914 [Volvox carteri f. nagariensis]